MSSVIIKVVETSGDPQDPTLEVEVSGDLKGTYQCKLSGIYNGEIVDFESIIHGALQICARGKNRKDFMRLVQRKNGVVINL